MKGGLLPAHGIQELRVAAGLAQLIQQQFHGLHRRQRIQYLAQNPHAVQLFLGQQQLFLARAALVDVDSGEDSLIHQLALQVDFQVAGALELFKDHVVHTAAGIDQ